MVSNKKDEKKELSREELRDLIIEEGYVVPDAIPVEPELRTSMWCRSETSFDFVKDYLTKLKTDGLYTLVTRYKVKGGHCEEFIKTFVDSMKPLWQKLRKKNLIENISFKQTVYGSGFTHEISADIPNSKSVFQVEKETDEFLTDLKYKEMTGKFDKIVVEYENLLLARIPITIEEEKE